MELNTRCRKKKKKKAWYIRWRSEEPESISCDQDYGEITDRCEFTVITAVINNVLTSSYTLKGAMKKHPLRLLRMINVLELELKK